MKLLMVMEIILKFYFILMVQLPLQIMVVGFLLECMRLVKVLQRLFIRFYMLVENLKQMVIKYLEDYMVLVVLL